MILIAFVSYFCSLHILSNETLMRMANTYFRFKQFHVRQDECPMKVSTDACLFGSLIEPAGADRILDIGSGTGLLSLMLAQRTSAAIDAVELDGKSFNQCWQNFAESPWHDRLNCFHTDIGTFADQSARYYDMIMSNPPFFEHKLYAKSNRRKLARHTDHLTHSKLLLTLWELLKPDGVCWLLLPPEEAEQIATKAIFLGLYQQKRIKVSTKPNKPAKRVIFTLSKKPSTCPSEEVLTIQDQSGHYTERFRNKLRPFYLAL